MERSTDRMMPAGGRTWTSVVGAWSCGLAGPSPWPGPSWSPGAGAGRPRARIPRSARGRAGPRWLVGRRPARRDPARVRVSIPGRGGWPGLPRHQGRSPRGPRRLLEEGLPRHRGQVLSLPGELPGRGGRPCRGGASWPRSAGPTPRAGPSPWINSRTTAICAVPRRWPSPSSPRRGGPTAGAGPRSRTRTRPPSRASRAIVELHLRWAPDSTVRWSGVSLTETSPPPPRTVRLATVHFKPSGGQTPADNCRMYEPLIAEAARQKADLVVLGETLTYVGLGKSYARRGRTDPGPVHRVFRRGWRGSTTSTSCPACSSATATWSTTSRC